MHTVIEPFFLLVQRHNVLRNLYVRENTVVKWLFIGEPHVCYPNLHKQNELLQYLHHQH